jgi:MATE family multidrug resistance protein
MFSRWSQRGGYREVLQIGVPLVISMGSTTIMQFTDRMFLANYSLESIAAATPAGIFAFMFSALFMGVATYTNVFVAQYTGAGRPGRVAASIWQCIYFCLGASLCLAALYFAAEPMFKLAGHPPEVQRLEVIYFQILAVGSGFQVLHSGMSSFFSGRGLTRPVALINLAGALFNIPLDYALINGLWGFPEWGIAGAGLATVLAWMLITLLYCVWIFLPKAHARYRFMANWRFDRELFGRLMKFGMPGGVMFFIEIFGISMFVFLVGRLGKAELAASNIVLSWDTVLFLPMIGFHIAVETMVGQAIGRGTPKDGVFSTHNALHVTWAYMLVVIGIFLLMPETLIEFFRPLGMGDAEFLPIKQMGVMLLYLLCIYGMLDGIYLIFIGAIRGAGDSFFVMICVFMLSTFILILPVYIMVEHLDTGVLAPWICLASYIGAGALVFWLRFRQGKWMKMRVIEE